MKTIIILALLLTACAAKPDTRCAGGCVSVPNVFKAVVEAYQKGYAKGFDDGEDAASLKELKAL